MSSATRTRLPAQGSAAEVAVRESVAVAGSCLTRDNLNSRFNADHGQHYDVRASSNQSSMIALMSPPIEAEFRPLRRMNDYDRWNVRADLSREFLPRFAEVPPELPGDALRFALGQALRRRRRRGPEGDHPA